MLDPAHTSIHGPDAQALAQPPSPTAGWEVDDLEFCYRPAVTGQHRAYIGARAIWNGGPDLDLLPDRCGRAARTAADLAELASHLTARSGAWREAMRSFRLGVARGEIDPRERQEVVLYDCDGIRIVGNSNASFGYFYLTASLA